MSKQLYEEALADVKKLKELAEDNAKRAILEAVTPRIKDLIENQLLGEAKEEEDKLLLDDMPDEDLESGMMSMPSFDSMPAVSSVPDEEGKVVLDLSMLSSPEGEFALSMDEPEVVDALVPAEKSEVVKAESAILQIEKKIDLYTNANPVLRETRSYLVGLASIISEVENMYSALKSSKNSSNKQNLVQRLIECHKTLKKLMEQETNMKNRLTLNEEDVTLTLKNLPDDINLDDLEVELVSGVEGEEGEEPESEEGEELDLGGEEEEEAPEAEEEETEETPEEGGEEEEGKMETSWLKGDVVVEIDENMLRKEISRMRALREEAVPSADGHGPGDLGDLEDEDLGDPLEMDLSEADKDPEGDYDMDEAEEDGDAEKPHQAHGMDEADLDELMQAYEGEEDGDAEKPHQAHGMDEVEEDGDDKKEKSAAKPGMDAQKEALVRKLATEARLQSEAKEKAGKAKKAAAKKMKEAQQKMKHAQKSAQKKQQKEAHQAKKDAQASAKQAHKLKEAYDYYATQFNESVLRTRKLQSMLAEADARSGSSKNGASSRLAEETETLRDKLAEMNLFNAKLLFTNKLLQNESLTKRQKAEVIERLDEAQNVREAKLVYESLVKALQGGSNGRVVSESASRGVIGSSSRPARPAATTSALNEGFEAERWAKLAGIIK